MWRFRSFTYHFGAMTYTLLSVLLDAARFFMLCLRPAPALAAENLFLRKQLAQYQERQVKPRRANDATRITLVWLSRFFDWRRALVIVQPATLIRWHRQGFRWFWHWRSKPGRPALPKDLQTLMRRMALENPTWGQVRIANELLLKLGLKVSPRTVRKYMPDHCVGSLGKRSQSQRWSTFLRNHAKSIIACDFCVAVTATFRVLYMFVIIADPEILGGKPIVEDTRLSVEHILGLLSHGMSHAEIVDAYPDLTVEDVNAVVQYAAEALHNDVLIEVKSTREAK